MDAFMQSGMLENEDKVIPILKKTLTQFYIWKFKSELMPLGEILKIICGTDMSCFS